MNPVELIRKKRDGQVLSDSEVEQFFLAYLKGKLPDYQMSAMLMAIYFQGLSECEMLRLCDVMIHSGKVADLSGIPVPKIDKHSTGGVGDKTSLILAPIVASLGVAVPMISGRGLGHTGGTLDKLELIPHFNVALSLSQYRRMLKQHHCALIGQTAALAPLDKLLYALRDVTATVESIPLIATSIMSKKIASGLDGLVLDVKTGKGAFMPNPDAARALAQMLVRIGEHYGKRVSAFLTDMNEPLGYAVGNWLEVKECLECLQGRKIDDLLEVTLTLSGEMLRLGGKCESLQEGIELSQQQLQNGKAFEKFLAIAKAQGADVSCLKAPHTYPKPKYRAEIAASQSGWIAEIDALEVGFSATLLGANRMKKDDRIDPKAGIVFRKKVGDTVQAGDCIAEIFTDRKAALPPVTARLQAAIKFSEQPVQRPRKVLGRVSVP
ncbi:MAG: thymidine phosphorylase [Chloroherpetonaceae bacterium]|nr:thymidine phosphorylase [Chloroherpetonaceae bacterium]